MKKMNRMPHEQAVSDESEVGPEHDGLPAIDGVDVEGHAMGHTKGERLNPGMPGTGGDALRQVVTDDDDVEGHAMGHTRGERFSPGLPGTGGD